MAYTFYKIAGFSGGLHSGQIGIELVSQNVAENYSVVNLKFQVRKDATSASHNEGGANLYIALDGTVKVSHNSIDFRYYSIGTWYNVLQALNVIIYHNADGNKTISLQGYCYTGVAAGTYNPGVQAIIMPTIARKSSISSLTPTVEANGTNEVTVEIARAVSTFTHNVYFTFGEYTESFIGVATSQSFAIPLSWLNAIPNSISGVGTCWVETYSDGAFLGYVSGAFTITAPATIIPVVTDIAFARETTGTDPFGTYAKGISKVGVSGVSVTNQYSASTALFKTYLHRATDDYTTGILHTGLPFISDALPYSGTMRLTTVVTDSRGRESVAYYEDFTVYDYFTPSLTVVAFRCNSSGVADPSGEYLSATMIVNVAPVNNDNSKAYVLEFKKTVDEDWTPIDTSALTGYSGTLTAIRSASSANTWEVRASITDKVNVATKATAVGTKRVAFNVGSSGTAVSFGKIAETPNLAEFDLPVKFNKAISIGDGSLLDFFYPIGTIYQTVSTELDTPAKMATHFGGTWEAWGIGKVPVGVDAAQTEFDTLEETGGAKTHTLDTTQIPSHAHGNNITVGPSQVGGGSLLTGANWAATYSYGTSGNAGGGLAHNNLQPYITCYFWKRTA